MEYAYNFGRLIFREDALFGSKLPNPAEYHGHLGN